MALRFKTPVWTLVFALSLGIAHGGATAQVSDDFSGDESIGAVWRLVDPAGDSQWTATNGWLHLSVPPGTGHDLRQGVNRTSRLLQDVPDGDFDIHAKFQSWPDEDFQAQGLVAEYDPARFVHLDLRREGPHLKIVCGTVNGGVTKVQGEAPAPDRGPVWLRMAREGDTWRGFHSTDGSSWTEAFRFTHALEVARVGLYGANAGAGGAEDSDLDRDDPVNDKSAARLPAPALEVVVDYFFETASPIEPEDGNVRNGERVTDDLLALYYFQAGTGNLVLDFAPDQPGLNLNLADTTAVDWLAGGGIDFRSPTVMTSAGPAEKINTACRASDRITIEAWLEPATTEQSGPARIVTISADPSNRNVSLAHGQWGSLPSDVYDVRLRTSETSLNGQPETVSPPGSLTGNLEHVVFTYDETGTSRIYVDGVETVAEPIGGDFATWDGAYGLAIGGEMDGSRNWLGRIHLAAVYDRALSPADIDINHRAGPRGMASTNLAPAVALSGITPGQEFLLTDALVLNAVAGDADGALVHVDFMAGDFLLFRDTAAPFAFTWNDPKVGSHQIRAVAEDDEGGRTTSGVIPVLVKVPAASAAALFTSDDFRDADLGPPWMVDDGTAGAAFFQAGGHLVADLPALDQDPWAVGAQEVFFHQAENDGDIAVELKLATVDFVGDAYGGLRFEGSGGEVVQLLGEYAGGAWSVSWDSHSGGGFSDAGSLPLPAVTNGLWLQVRRTSGAWSLLHSTDGMIWQSTADLSRTMALERCGLVAGALGAAGGGPTVAFDYAFDLAQPIVPEDGGGGGDLTGPVIGPVTATPDLDSAVLSWQTDEPAFFRLDYGTTPAHELGSLQGQAYLTNHEVEVPGLAAGARYHFAVTCVDTAGNFSATEDLSFFTDAVAVRATGPAAGETYRETQLGMDGDFDWRVTDPNAPNPGAAAFLPNPVLSLDVPDLTGAVRAELIIDRWGGHPGTSDRRIRLAGRSWLHLPEMETIPAPNPECYMFQDNLMIDIPLNQLEAGSAALEGTSGGQTCYDFGWAQWGWYGVVLRVYYDGSQPHPTGSILSPAAGDTIVDAAALSISASSPGTVEEVQVLGWYEGPDTDGDGVFTEWHREYHRDAGVIDMAADGIVARLTTAPWTGTWDAAWVPDQQPGSVKLQARILDDSGMWYVTDFVEDLSLRHSDGVVRMYTMDDVPESFWVRDGRSKSAEFTIPVQDDLANVSEARMITSTWNGAVGRVTLNGLWQSQYFGASYFHQVDTHVLSTSAFVSGANTVTIFSSSTGHGMEMLWPGPMFLVRYGPEGTAAALPGSGDLDNDGRVDVDDALMVLDHLVGAATLPPELVAAGDLSGDGRLDPWDAALIAGADPAKATPEAGSPTWGEARGKFGQLTIPLESGGGPSHSLWLEVTAPGLEDMVLDVVPALDEGGLFRWRASGDKLYVAFAASATSPRPDRILEIVLDVSAQDPGGTLSGVLATDGGEPVRLSDTPLTAVPVTFRLGDNYPNPFNPATKISFDLPVSGRVSLRIHDVRGRVVRTLAAEEMSFGSHTLVWAGGDDQGRAVPSGVYFYRLEAQGFSATHKMLLLK